MELEVKTRVLLVMSLGPTGWFLVCKMRGIGHLYKILPHRWGR